MTSRSNRRFPWQPLLAAWVPFMTGAFALLGGKPLRGLALAELGGAGVVLAVIGVAYVIWRWRRVGVGPNPERGDTDG